MGPVHEQEIEKARVALRERFASQGRLVEARRTHRFLWAQSWLVLAVVATIAVNPILQALPAAKVQPMASLTAVVLLVTLLGWRVYVRTENYAGLILGILYADVVIGTVGYFAVGDFETPNVGCIALLVFLAPLFGPKRHAWGLASLAMVLYAGLLAGRVAGLVPYESVLPDATAAQLADPGFVGDSLLGFAILVFGAAFLAGEASLGVLTTQGEMEAEVESATRKLSRANAELQDRNRALDEFNAALSHDLKSPLQSSLLAAESLLFSQPPLSPDQIEMAKNIADGAERMGELVQELLKLSRMDSDLQKWADVELQETVEAVLADLDAALQETGARVDIAGPLPPALGNPSLIRELLQNLVENALKYGGSAGRPPRVLIEETEAPWARVAVAVEDDGPGIPPEERDLVFRPFLQLHRDRHREGVGAGLAIVRRIVSVHGGRIRCEEGASLGGARFVIDLPRPGTIDTLAG